MQQTAKEEQMADVATKREILTLLAENCITEEERIRMILALNHLSQERAEQAVQKLKERVYPASELGEALFRDGNSYNWLRGCGFEPGDKVRIERQHGKRISITKVQ